jgi:hypothetical protein
MRYAFIGMVFFTGVGFAAEPDAAREQQRLEALDKAKAYCQSLDADPALDPIRSKAPLGGGKPTPGMLANEDRASDDERPVIREWAKRSMQCQEKFLSIHRQYGSQMHVAIYTSTVEVGNALKLQLHNGQLTYGQYCRERQKLIADTHNAWISVDAELAKQNAEVAQRVADQFSEDHLAYQQKVQEQQQAFQHELEKQREAVRCNHIGTYTYCNY